MITPLVKALRARPRLLASVVLGAVAFAAFEAARPGYAFDHALIGYNLGAIVYLVMAWRMMRAADSKSVHRNALDQDEGRMAILALVVLASLAVLVAVGTQVLRLKDLHGPVRAWHLGLAALTVAVSWLFTQLLFALHYAHDFYLARARGAMDPLLFPGTDNPVYSDFFHFACVIGTSAQTADISFNGSAIRPVGTAHCILAFVFNTTLLALCMNLAAGQLG